MSLKNPPQKVGLALGGGSTYGVAHIGALVALTEAKIPIDCISGTSAGALVAACFAFDMPLDEMATLTKTLNWKKFSRFAYSTMGLRSNEPMNAFITDALGNVKIEDAHIPLAIVATNIETLEMVTFRSGPLQPAVRASTCIPGLFVPVEIDGAQLVDGGLTENVPLTALNEMGATLKIGINLINNKTISKPKNVFDILVASFQILSSHRDQNVPVHADIIIEPDLSPFDSMSFKNGEGMYNAGYSAAKKAIPLILEKLQTTEKKSESLLTKFFSLWK